MKRGFTLIEVLIVAVIMVSLTISLVSNFSRTRSALPRSTVGLVNDIHSAQNRAASGVLHQGSHRCGYGVHFEEEQYIIFAGPPPDPATGCSDNFVFDQGEAVTVVSLQAGLELAPEGDVYFVPPLPTTYVNGFTDRDMVLQLRERGTTAACPSAECRIITINAGGQIQSQ